MNEEDLWPPIEEALIKKLEEIYPEKCPDLEAKDRDIWHYGGGTQCSADAHIRLC